MNLNIRSLGLALLIAVIVTGLMGWLWQAIGGGTMSLHGWVALGLGMVGTAVLAWVLMALAFRSDSDGWDDRADQTVETSDRTVSGPGRITPGADTSSGSKPPPGP